jgi:hypothetical protein
MTDTKPQYRSEGLQIFEWPQPQCEIMDPVSRDLVAIKTPEDARAVRDSMNKFLHLVDPETVVAREQLKVSSGTILTCNLLQLRDEYMAIFGTDDREDTNDLIEQVLRKVEQAYHLSPKYVKEGDFVNPLFAVEEPIEKSVADLWSAVNS